MTLMETKKKDIYKYNHLRIYKYNNFTKRIFFIMREFKKIQIKIIKFSTKKKGKEDMTRSMWLSHGLSTKWCKSRKTMFLIPQVPFAFLTRTFFFLIFTRQPSILLTLTNVCQNGVMIPKHIVSLISNQFISVSQSHTL